ncbi:MAG TPA: hypothetical protein VJP80_03245 [Candidatus Saccharimonadales bacterium]|nr:hypothetical protein [Candidatus Saccharimonadales bacterium]
MPVLLPQGSGGVGPEEYTLFAGPHELQAAIDDAMLARTGIAPEGDNRVMVHERTIAEARIPEPAREFLASIPVEPGTEIVSHREQVLTDWRGSAADGAHEVSRVAFVRREDIPSGGVINPGVGAIREIRLRYDADEYGGPIGRIVTASICDYDILETASSEGATLQGSEGPIRLEPEFHIAILGETVNLGDLGEVDWPDQTEVSQIINHLRQSE